MIDKCLYKPYIRSNNIWPTYHDSYFKNVLNIRFKTFKFLIIKIENNYATKKTKKTRLFIHHIILKNWFNDFWNFKLICYYGLIVLACSSAKWIIRSGCSVIFWKRFSGKYFLSSSHDNDRILAPILVRNAPDSRIFKTMQDFSITTLFHPQIMWKFMILVLFEYEIGRETYRVGHLKFGIWIGYKKNLWLFFQKYGLNRLWMVNVTYP